MTTYTDAVIVGGGQAGLSVSYYLRREARDHVVLEQAEKPAEVWRNHRWDSFTLNTPNWQSRLPGADHPGADPDGFVSREGIVDYFETYAKRFRLPVRYRKRVSSVERDPQNGTFIVTIEGGERIQTCNVVIATGLYQTPKVPPFATDLPAGVRQVHSDAYRNPQELAPGAVLVVGSAQSGAQIAEELCAARRKVYLAVGHAGRTPRRYRGKDANWWHDKLGDYDKTVSELPSPKAKFTASRSYPGLAAAIRSICTSLPATASCWLVTSAASTKAKSNSPQTSMRTSRQPTDSKPILSNVSTPTSPERE